MLFLPECQWQIQQRRVYRSPNSAIPAEAVHARTSAKNHQLQCDFAYMSCCDFGAPRDRSQGSIASSQHKEAQYAFASPGDCGAPPLNVTV